MESIPEGKLVPLEAYRYWPKSNYIYTGTDKSIVRYIFYKIDFTNYELDQLKLFKKFINQKEPDLQLPSFFVDQELLRILLGCKFCLKKSFGGLLNAIKWRSENLALSYNSLFPLCKDILNSGVMYLHGRDHRFRPLLVLNVAKLDLVKNNVYDYCNLLCFLLEFAIQKLMLPGQVENWVVITDLNNQGLSDLPIRSLGSIIKILQDNFRCRMIVNYVVNAPSSIYFMWSIIKKFVEEHTIKKIRIMKEGVPTEMSTHFAKSQYEKKYGGTSPDLEVYWPPCFPPGPYSIEGENIENVLSDVCTYHLYNHERSEISSEMGEITEGININIPDILIEHHDFLEPKHRKSSSSFRASAEGSVGRKSLQILHSPQNPRMVSSCCESFQRELSEHSEQSESETPGLPPITNFIVQKEMEEMNLESHISINKEVEPPKRTRFGKLCGICSRKRCEIW